MKQNWEEEFDKTISLSKLFGNNLDGSDSWGTKEADRIIKDFIRKQIEKALSEISKVASGQIIKVSEANTFAEGYEYRNEEIKQNISNYLKI